VTRPAAVQEALRQILRDGSTSTSIQQARDEARNIVEQASDETEKLVRYYDQRFEPKSRP